MMMIVLLPSLVAMTGLKLLFENDRIRVSDVRLHPGKSIRQTFEFPTIRWQVDEGILQIIDDEGSKSSSLKNLVVVADRTVIFEEVGSSCEVINGSQDDIFRQIWFEIKLPPRRTEEETKRILDNAIFSTDVGTQLLFENRYCRVWDFYLEPNGGDPNCIHHHVLDYVFVYVAKGRLLGYSHDGHPGLFDSINEDGDVTWFDLPDGAETMVECAHGGKNGYPDIPMREYLVELK